MEDLEARVAARLNRILRVIEVEETQAMHEERFWEPWQAQWRRLINIRRRFKGSGRMEER